MLFRSVCSQVPRHEYQGLFSGYEMMEDYNGNSLIRQLRPLVTLDLGRGEHRLK